MKRILTILLLTVLAAGCSDNDSQVTIKSYSIQEVTGVSFSKGLANADVNMALDIDNPGPRQCALESLSAVLYKEDGPIIAELTLNEAVTVEKRSSGTVIVPLKASFHNPVALMASGLFNNEGINLQDFKTDVNIKVRSGMFHKEIVKKGIPIEELKDIFDINGLQTENADN